MQCPLGVTTWLTEDPDDDGDGIPDVSEGAGSGGDSEDSSPIGTIILVIIFIIAAAFMLMRRNGDVE